MVQATALFLGRNILLFSMTSTRQNPYHVISGNMDNPDSLSPGEPLIIGVKNMIHFQSMYPFIVDLPNVSQASQHHNENKFNKDELKRSTKRKSNINCSPSISRDSKTGRANEKNTSKKMKCSNEETISSKQHESENIGYHSQFQELDVNENLKSFVRIV